ncbi:hypothetical protein SNK04_014026 [Fusarium graminearum]
MLRQDRDIWSCELIGVHPIRRQGADLRSATLDIHQLVADALWRHPATAEVGLRLDLVLGIRSNGRVICSSCRHSSAGAECDQRAKGGEVRDRILILAGCGQ